MSWGDTEWWLEITPAGYSRLARAPGSRRLGFVPQLAQGTQGLRRVGRLRQVHLLREGSARKNSVGAQATVPGHLGPGSQPSQWGGASTHGAGPRRARKGAVSGNLGTRSSLEPLGRSRRRDSKQHQALSYLPAREKSSPWLQHPRAATLAQHRLPVPALG